MSGQSPAALSYSRREFFFGLAASALLGSGRALAAKTTPAEAEEAALRGSDPSRRGPFVLGKTIYANPLRAEEDVKGFRLEGQAKISFPDGRLRLENQLDSRLGQKSNFVYWFPEELPADFAAGWDFRALREPGLCMVFFAARARSGGDIFSPGLAPRSGEYVQYNRSDINTLHLSYFRRVKPGELPLNVCNLRKSRGSHLVAEGADPLPSVSSARPPYRIELIKCGPEVAFFINRLPILSWKDDGRTYGPVLGAGRFAFRQMAPLLAEYENFTVREVTKPGQA